MNRRKFLSTGLVGISTIPVIGSLPSSPNDKYSDPEYGHWYKTPVSIFTIREIEMMCRKWGWNHVEEFIPFYKGHKPPYILGQHGVGKFISKSGKEYGTSNTFRCNWFKPESEEETEEFKKSLKNMAGDYYSKPNRDYYFYDVIFIGGKPYDAFHDIRGNSIEPTEYDLKLHNRLIYKVILYHMAIGKTDGEAWSKSKI